MNGGFPEIPEGVPASTSNAYDGTRLSPKLNDTDKKKCSFLTLSYLMYVKSLKMEIGVQYGHI